MSYTVIVRVELDAEDKEEAAETCERLWSMVFNEAEVIELECTAPSWVPRRPGREEASV